MTQSQDAVLNGDRIELRDLRVMGVVGVLAHERTAPQPLSIDLDIYADLASSARTDALDDTSDYGAAAEAVAHLCATTQPQLLETLATEVAMHLCAWSGVIAVTATVRKLRPPVPLQLESAGVRVTRFAAEMSSAPQQ